MWLACTLYRWVKGPEKVKKEKIKDEDEISSVQIPSGCEICSLILDNIPQSQRCKYVNDSERLHTQYYHMKQQRLRSCWQLQEQRYQRETELMARPLKRKLKSTCKAMHRFLSLNPV